LSIVWTWPTITSLLGISGIVRTRRYLRRNRRYLEDDRVFLCHDQLIVIVPTIGRHDTYPALERSVRSYVDCLPACFPQFRVDVVVEEGCEAYQRISMLARYSPYIRVVVVPKSYSTPNHTRFKARANHFAHELRIAEGEARHDVWVLHMDDDTGVGLDTGIAMAQFIEKQRWAGDNAKHLAQGILTYPRENAVNRLTWLADAVRPADDVSRFARFTGRGLPLAGLHGELMLIRASIEASIGWDFGPATITEDAQLALIFCRRYPGSSAWFQGRCYGASPATARDFIKQRERWSWGLVGLACNRSVPLRHRLLLAYSVLSWIVGPMQHIAFVLAVGFLIGDVNTTPVSLFILPAWALNLAYTVWMYREGLKINAMVSQSGRRSWWERIAVIVLIPYFSLLEGIGGLLGLIRFVRRAENKFVVIAKPA
jgi:cellulose synthase/poly-beta-1,6-N-acetylglucosamine synthase-like glycosyltransferase